MPSSACRSVQYAVDQADEGDEIRVATGVYTGVSTRSAPVGSVTPVITQVVYLSKTLTIQGGYTTTNWVTPTLEANPTTLDAQRQGRVLVIDGADPTISGLTLTGGNAAKGGDDATGSGVLLRHSSATLSGNTIFSNTAGEVANSGGGLYLHYSPATLSGNTISSNGATQGGGLYLWQSPATLNGNTILSNTASAVGGGLYLVASNATLNGNTIVSNRATYAGGLYLRCNVTLSNNIIADNKADIVGSAMALDNNSHAMLAHTTIADNHGGDGSGIYVLSGSINLVNTILVSHTVGITVASGSTAILEATLWGDDIWANILDWGGAGTIVTGTRNFWGDPAFASDNYRLTVNSAAIDRGVDTDVDVDIDGQLRLWSPDLGADEYWTPGAPWYIYLPIVLR